MKRVSFEIAKALKEAGYPQDYIETWYYCDKEIHHIDDPYIESTTRLFRAPTCLEVWLWLWRVRNTYLDLRKDGDDYFEVYLNEVLFPILEKDPEVAIEKAIEYLVDNNLIK